MKKIALLLCVVLMLSTLMVGCKKSEEQIGRAHV